MYLHSSLFAYLVVPSVSLCLSLTPLARSPLTHSISGCAAIINLPPSSTGGAAASPSLAFAGQSAGRRGIGRRFAGILQFHARNLFPNSPGGACTRVRGGEKFAVPRPFSLSDSHGSIECPRARASARLAAIDGQIECDSVTLVAFRA